MFFNREVDGSEKLMEKQKIIDALKRDVLETRERLDNMSGMESPLNHTSLDEFPSIPSYSLPF